MSETHPLLHYAESWPPELDHFSASSVKMLVRCPEQWRQRYVLNKRIPPGINLIAGHADHAAIEASMREKITSHVDWPIGDVTDLFTSELDREIESEGGLTEIEFDKDTKGKVAKTKKLDALRVEGMALVERYQRHVSPQVQPTHVEQPFEVQVPALPVKMVGYVDLMTDEVIIDRKRAGSARYQPEWSVQAEVYQYVFPKPHLWHLSVTSGGGKLVLPHKDNNGNWKGVLDVGPPDRIARTVTHIAAEIGHYYSRYGPDEPWPVKGKLHPWACNYCGYRGGCWGWAT